jgi:ABC-type multidrug transport system fused ATPase/permease subunit
MILRPGSRTWFALDGESEELVLKALVRLRQGRTTLMVAHRFNTLSIVDRTLRLEQHARNPVGS